MDTGLMWIQSWCRNLFAKKLKAGFFVYFWLIEEYLSEIILHSHEIKAHSKSSLLYDVLYKILMTQCVVSQSKVVQRKHVRIEVITNCRSFTKTNSDVRTHLSLADALNLSV